VTASGQTAASNYKRGMPKDEKPRIPEESGVLYFEESLIIQTTATFD
jgi:hypothetical protein